VPQLTLPPRSGGEGGRAKRAGVGGAEICTGGGGGAGPPPPPPGGGGGPPPDPSPRRVVAVCGDGGLGQYLAEVTTAVKEGFPLTHVVLDNGELAKISREQLGAIRPVWETNLVNPDFAEYARLCGGAGWSVREPDELRPALEAALAHADGPSLVEIHSSSKDV